MNSNGKVDTYKLGWSNSKAVGVQTPLIRRSMILIKPPPLPEGYRRKSYRFQ